MHNWLNTGHQKKKINANAVADCPVCESQEESWQHLFQCMHADSLAIKTLALTAFKSELIRLETAPILCKVLCYKIAQCCKLPPLTAPHIPNDKIGDIVRDIVEDHQIIGWDNFMKGRI
eukprot:9100230-Ditylum_brightwellii.AAC.1